MYHSNYCTTLAGRRVFSIFFPCFQKLLRFPARKGLLGGKPYLTLLSIDEHNLYYQGKDRMSHPEGSRTGIMLYNLK